MAMSQFAAKTARDIASGIRSGKFSAKLQILLLMTALSFLPAFILMATSFTRIIVVLAILRQALGLQRMKVLVRV